MKAISILKPIEFSIETKGESWTQGSVLQGLLKIKNQEGTEHPLSAYKIAIGHADIKKVHAKKPGCFKIYEQVDLPQNVITANGMMEFPFEFKLDQNLPVSDKKSSFHLLYGKLDSPFHLQMPILPNPLFLELIKLFESFFRFKVKEFKGTNKGIDYILLPPNSKEMAFVEALTLSLRIDDQDLKLDYTFNLQKFDLVGVTNKVIKEDKMISKTLTPKEYLMGKTLLDQDKLLRAIELVLSEVKRR